MEKGPTGFPSFEKNQYPEILMVDGIDIDYKELVRRIKIFMYALPRLKTDYWAATAHIAREGRLLTLAEFREICSRMSLREELFTTLSREYFDEFLFDNGSRLA